MENPHYNHIKGTSKRVQNDACISSAQKVKVVLAEKDNARAWLSEHRNRFTMDDEQGSAIWGTVV